MNHNLNQEKHQNIDHNENSTITSTPIMNARVMNNINGGEIFNATPLMTPLVSTNALQKKEDALKSLRGIAGLSNNNEDKAKISCMTEIPSQRRTIAMNSPISIYSKKVVKQKMDLPLIYEKIPNLGMKKAEETKEDKIIKEDNKISEIKDV